MHVMPGINGRLRAAATAGGPWLRSSLSPDASDRRAWLAMFLCCLPVYVVTAHYVHASVDTASAVAPAWQLAHHGNLWMEHLRPRPYWSVPAGHHLVSNRMPGVELVNLPFVLLLFWLGPSIVPAAMTASGLTAAAVGLLFLVFRRLTTTRLAVMAAIVMAFGTSLWTISSAEIWPHTLDAFCLALVMYALARGRSLWAGVAFAVAITARPHVAVIALVAGLGLGWTRRSLRTVLAIGLPAVCGLVFVLGWNHLLYGQASIGGGYASYVETNLTQTSSSGLSFFATNVAGFLISPQRGLFLFLPLSALLLLGLPTGWRLAPPWVRLMAIGGVSYTALQLRINGFGGGDAFYGYRLPTELIVCVAPLAVLVVGAWVRARGWRVRWARALAVFGVGMQAVGAFAFSIPSSSASMPWRASPVFDALLARPLIAVVLLVATLAASGWLLQREPTGLRAIRTWLRGSDRTDQSEPPMMKTSPQQEFARA